MIIRHSYVKVLHFNSRLDKKAFHVNATNNTPHNSCSKFNFKSLPYHNHDLVVTGKEAVNFVVLRDKLEKALASLAKHPKNSLGMISLSPSPIILCVLVLVLIPVIIVPCTEGGSSTNQRFKQEQEQDQTPKVPRPAQANPPVVDLTYVNHQAPRSGIMKRIIVDLNDDTGLRLRQLWPLTSYKSKRVMVGYTLRVVLELPEGTLHDYTMSGSRHPEVQHHGQYTGIWVNAMMDANLFDFNVLTRGNPVETQPIAAYTLTTVGTGTGQTMKSFIIK